MTFYVTKWALTMGIVQVEGEKSNGGKYMDSGDGKVFARIGMDAFEDLEAARTNVRQRVLRKVASLNRQLKELQELGPGSKFMRVGPLNAPAPDAPSAP